MKRLFFLGVFLFLVVATAGYLVWRIAVHIWDYWRLTRGLKELQEAASRKEQERQRSAEERLQNGCQHDFFDPLGALPPETCRHCGLQRRRPPGPCDHVWRLSKEPMPGSYCEKCGRRYLPIKA